MVRALRQVGSREFQLEEMPPGFFSLIDQLTVIVKTDP